jgi:hypothetical protein
MHVFVKLDGHYETSEIGSGPVRVDEGELTTMVDMVTVLRAVADDVLRQHSEEAIRKANGADHG